MLNINFVPDDYIQNNKSHKINLLYLVLFVFVMLTLTGSFITIKVRQRAIEAEEAIVNTRVNQMQESIKQLEEFEEKRRVIMKTALTTTELLEPVPRSVLFASLTNNLPSGVSLLSLKLVQREPKNVPSRPKATSKYKLAKDKKAALSQPKASKEQLLETYISIDGIAPSDLQVAGYINQLSISPLFDNVTMVESKERSQDGVTFRQFRLTAVVKVGSQLSKDDIIRIRNKS